MIDVNTIVSERNYDKLTSIIAQLLTSRPLDDSSWLSYTHLLFLFLDSHPGVVSEASIGISGVCSHLHLPWLQHGLLLHAHIWSHDCRWLPRKIQVGYVLLL